MVRMTEELIDYVIYLIDSKKGDIGRLNYILSALQDGRPLYNSDKKYVDSLISNYIGPAKKKFGDIKSAEELRVELVKVRDRLEKVERHGYRKPVGRKAVFFFVTFFFGWHAVITIASQKLQHDIQNINQYFFPLYQLEKIIPTQYLTYIQHLNLSIPKIVAFVWGAMMFTWIIIGFIYLVKYIRSGYNPARS